MQVIRAEAHGLCFGVQDALDVAFARDDASETTVYGELVHNETVLRRLTEQGYRMAPENGRETAVDTDKVLITAHGISNRERERLQAAGKELIDTTCPLVQKVHNAALRLQEAGYHVVVLGKHGHVEVRGVTGDLDSFSVVASREEVATLEIASDRIGVVTQTTFPEPLAETIVAALRKRHPDKALRFVNTVCEPTRQRRLAIARLLPQVEKVVVVGGRNSNNTRQLVQACTAGGVPALHVQGPADLDAGWLQGCAVVGLTAGTSTLGEVVDAVAAALEAMPAATPAATPAAIPAAEPSLVDR